MNIEIITKLPDYCRTTKNPRFKIVEVKAPQQWLPRYDEVAAIIKALSDCEKYNREQGQTQYSLNEFGGN